MEGNAMSDRKYDREKEILQTVLEHASREAGGKTGFVQRESKVTATRFVQIMVLACLEQADVSLRDMVTVGVDLGVDVTAAGLHQRMNKPAIKLLQATLRSALTQCQREATADCEILQAFPAVYIEDSSYVSLPAHLAARFPGSGGNASAASAKVWLTYEYRSGTVQALEVIPGRKPDQACEVPDLPRPPGSLHLFDLGYFSQRRLSTVAAQGNYFICRFQHQTALYSLAGERLDWEQDLASATGDQVEFEALLGARTRLPVRIIAQRLPQSVEEERRQKAWDDARRMRRTPSQRKLDLLAWNIFCTNVPTTIWSRQQILAVYPLRWQIELLFKLWKSDAGLNRLGNWRTERILSQLYARLIALVLAHYLIAPVRFTDTPQGTRELSLPKAFALLQRMVPAFAAAIATGWQLFPSLLNHLYHLCRRLALKDQRHNRPSTYDSLLLAGA